MPRFIRENDHIVYAGRHLVLDVYHYEPLENDDLIHMFEKACKDTGASVMFSHIQPFEGGGTSGAIILAESHLTWHEWRERNFMAIDIFVCGECNPEAAIPRIISELKAKEHTTSTIKRGIINSRK